MLNLIPAPALNIIHGDLPTNKPMVSTGHQVAHPPRIGIHALHIVSGAIRCRLGRH